jgi:hypothetical protein
VNITGIGIGKQEAVISMQLYPNPNTGNFTIELPIGGALIEVLDVQGKSLYQRKVTSTRFEIESEGLNDGLYLIQASNKDGTARTPFIVKQ